MSTNCNHVSAERPRTSGAVSATSRPALPPAFDTQPASAREPGTADLDESPHLGYLRSVIVTVTDTFRPDVRSQAAEDSNLTARIWSSRRSQIAAYSVSKSLPTESNRLVCIPGRPLPGRSGGDSGAAHGNRTRTTRLEASHAAFTSRPPDAASEGLGSRLPTSSASVCRRRGTRTLPARRMKSPRHPGGLRDASNAALRPVRESNPVARFRRPGSGSTGQAHESWTTKMPIECVVPAARFELATFGV
jgi:hypothetical protein